MLKPPCAELQTGKTTKQSKTFFSPWILKVSHHKHGHLTLTNLQNIRTTNVKKPLNTSQGWRTKVLRNGKPKNETYWGAHAKDIRAREENGVPALIRLKRAFRFGFSSRKNFTYTHWHVNDVHVKFWVQKIWRLAAGRIRSGRSSLLNGFINRFRCQPVVRPAEFLLSSDCRTLIAIISRSTSFGIYRDFRF